MEKMQDELDIQHTYDIIDNKSYEYWDFSFHEIAVNDLPACIDYILDYTNNEQIS